MIPQQRGLFLYTGTVLSVFFGLYHSELLMIMMFNLLMNHRSCLSLKKNRLIFYHEMGKYKVLCPEHFPVLGNFTNDLDCYKVLAPKNPSINVK